MNVSLTTELEQFIQTKVESGLYHSASEVIREGLRLLKERDMLQEAKLAALRQEIQSGVDQANQGQFSPHTVQDIKTVGRRRLSQRQAIPPKAKP